MEKWNKIEKKKAYEKHFKLDNGHDYEKEDKYEKLKQFKKDTNYKDILKDNSNIKKQKKDILVPKLNLNIVKGEKTEGKVFTGMGMVNQYQGKGGYFGENYPNPNKGNLIYFLANFRIGPTLMFRMIKR